MTLKRIQAAVSLLAALVFGASALYQLNQSIKFGQWVPWWDRVDIGEPCTKPASCWSELCVGDRSAGSLPIADIFGSSVDSGFCSMKCVTDTDCEGGMFCHPMMSACVPGPLRENGVACEHSWQCRDGACGVDPGTLFEPSTDTQPRCLDSEAQGRVESRIQMQRALDF